MRLTNFLFIAAFTASGCVATVDLSDKSCDDDHPCADGYLCSAGVCLEERDAVGRAGGPCTSGGGCDPGLACLSDRCVALEDADAGARVDAGADSGSDGGDVDAGSDGGTVDGGVVDGGAGDGGAVDAGTPDAGGADAGTSDAGTEDSGFGDAGPFDASMPSYDAGPDGGCGPACATCNSSPLVSLGTKTSTNDTGLDQRETSCAPTGGAEAVLRFTAPATDVYSFRVQPTGLGDPVDHVVAVVDGCDDGSRELSCAANLDYGAELVGLPLTAGQTVAIVVDAAYGEDTGPFELEILARAGVCEAAPIGEGTTNASTDGGHALFPGVCGAHSAAESNAHNFVAPASDAYSFVLNSAFDLSLGVFDGCDSPAPESCSEQTVGGVERVIVDLAEAQTVVATVNGQYVEEAGAYALSVASRTAACAAAPVVSDSPASGNTLLGTGLFSGSCEATGDGVGDHLWRFDSDTTQEYSFTLESVGDTGLIVTDGCGGGELACLDLNYSGNDQETVSVVVPSGESVFVSARDMYPEEAGDVTLTVRDRAALCAAAPSIEVGVPVMGSTVNAPDAFSNSCYREPGQRARVHSFSAPASDVYSFHASGTADLSLGVFSACDAADGELRCASSDFGEARISLALTSGQEVGLAVREIYAHEDNLYNLEVRSRSDECTSPHAHGLGATNRTTANGAAVFTGSCWTEGGGRQDLVELYPGDTGGTFRVVVTASYDVDMLLFDNCMQPVEALCKSAETTIDFPMVADVPRLLVVTPTFDGEGGAYSLNFSRLP